VVHVWLFVPIAPSGSHRASSPVGRGLGEVGVNRIRRVTVQPIRLWGDPVLRTPAETVSDFDKQLRVLVADLAETMERAPGSGLAAPQIGVGLRVFTYHVDDEQSGHLVNPVLHFPSEDEQDGPEGCLSIPGLSFDCRRRAHVVAHGQNGYGDPVTVEGTAKLARCLQHETDHLDGVLFVDRLDPSTRKAAMQAIRDAPWYATPAVTAPAIKVSPHPSYGWRR
jgi:peptide deformylase